MHDVRLSRLSDDELDHLAQDAAAKDRAAMALLIAHMAELDARQLYLQAGYPTMLDYCRDGLGMDWEEAPQRIDTARAARQFPAIFEMLADGRLNPDTVALLAPHLTEANAAELLAAAAHMTESQTMEMLPDRTP